MSNEFTLTIAGREVRADVALIEQLLAEQPTWGRSRLSVELCERWNWRAANGRLKDMACRNLLLRLERGGRIVLPPRQSPSPNGSRNRAPRWVAHRTEPIDCALGQLRPLDIRSVAPGSEDDALVRCLLANYHFLGYRNTVGENLRYLVRSRQGWPLACAAFGAAAWQLAARDELIDWTAEERGRNLSFVTNNSRFLIVPWARVAHLASHILSRVAKRVSADWRVKYHHPLYLLETFVDPARHRGTCYRAANWLRVGQSTGRTRNDRYNTIAAPAPRTSTSIHSFATSASDSGRPRATERRCVSATTACCSSMTRPSPRCPAPPCVASPATCSRT